MRNSCVLGAALILSLSRLTAAQTSPFVPEPLFRELVNELSGDRAFESVRQLTHFHRTGGSQDFFAAAEWIRASAEASGLEDVRLIRQKWNRHGWTCRFGEAWLVEPEEAKLADYGALPLHIADHSRTTKVTAELVDVGEGTSAADYEGRKVEGKIVLASGSLGTVHREAVWKRKALGVLSHATNRNDVFDAPDQVAWGRVPYEAKDVEGVEDGASPGFAIMISPRRGRRLQKQMAESGETFRLKVDIEADYPEGSQQAMVEAWIRGSEVHDQQIVLTAHIQEEKTSANDNGSGCASQLEIGRTLARLIEDGRIPRPRRDIRFWWVNELSSQPRYFREHPQEPRKMLVNLSQDMVGARQSWGGRVQYASRLPWSLPHALDDVMESVLGLVRDGNTDLLTLRGRDLPHPFTKEVSAVKGSREPFHARMVPYFDSTDHHAFTPAHIGVPGTSLTNWPDGWIHSTGDDLENIDATQLERNALIVAAVALYFANAGPAEATTLAPYAAAQGRSRIAADVATAVAHMASAAPQERAGALAAARSLVRQAHRREIGALASIRGLSGEGRAMDLVTSASKRLEAAQAAELQALDAAYTAITGQQPPTVELSKDERKLQGRRYAPVPGIGAYRDAMEEVKPVEGLHRMMLFEVYNFADGQRTGLEVYEAVAAEALAAGEWYYGRVRPGDVLEALERARKAGAFTLEPAS